MVGVHLCWNRAGTLEGHYWETLFQPSWYHSVNASRFLILWDSHLWSLPKSYQILHQFNMTTPQRFLENLLGRSPPPRWFCYLRETANTNHPTEISRVFWVTDPRTRLLNFNAGFEAPATQGAGLLRCVGRRAKTEGAEGNCLDPSWFGWRLEINATIFEILLQSRCW